MTSLTIFFDHQCGLCRRFREWLEAEPAHLTLRFISYRSPEALQIFPEIEDYNPGEEIVVLADDRSIYQGADAWIICLWATQEYRAWSERLAKPALRPMVRKLCLAVSANRHTLSGWLPSAGEDDLKETIDRLNDPGHCEAENCTLDSGGNESGGP